MMGIEFDESKFKKRKGFGNIVIDQEMFKFNWANTDNGPLLILYNTDGLKIEIPYTVWTNSVEHCQEFLNTKSHQCHTWHGKHKKGPCFGRWGKAEAAEMYRKYKISQETKN